MERISCLLSDDQPTVTLEQLGQGQQKRWQDVKFSNVGLFNEDVLVEILSRLAVKYVVRMKCVCKSWYALIDDRYLVKRHYQIQCSRCKADGDVPILSFGVPFPSIHLMSKKNDDIPLDLTPALAHDSGASLPNIPFDFGHIVGVVNGIVCLRWDNVNFVLWNPATREFKAIPPWVNVDDYCYFASLNGFAHDSVSSEFKIVRTVWNDTFLIGHELYSSVTNSWKRLRQKSLTTAFSRGSILPMGGYLNGVCYWFHKTTDSYLITTEKILSFNFSTEVFEVFTPPQNAIEPNTWDITMYKDSLAIIVSHTVLGKEECHFKVWVVSEFDGNSGIPKSWQHVLTIGPFHSSVSLPLGRFRLGGDVIFPMVIFNPENYDYNDCCKSCLYNPSTGTFKKLGVRLLFSFDYVESLFSLSNSTCA